MFGNWQVHVAFEVWGILFCLMAGVIAYIASEKTNGKRMWLTCLFLTQILELAFDSMAWIFRGNTTAAGYYLVRISNAGVYIFNYMLIVVSTGYLCASVKKKSEQWAGLWMASAVAGAGIALTVITQYYPLLYRFDETNHCMRCDWFFLAHAIALLGVVLELVMLTKYRTSFEKNKLIVLYIYLLMPMIALIWQLFFYGISLLQIMNTISLMCLFMVDAFRQTQKLVAKERELNDMKIQVVLSQIKPHFMYNVLNTITYLCDKDASVAKKALYDFSMYLRGNLDSLTSRALVPLDRELDLVERYLSLQKLRMGDELNIIYDIEDNGYMLPPMTLEPFVENAVTHGLAKADEGGTLSIRTRLGEQNHEITIRDDGVGFDPASYHINGEGEHQSIGIENVRKRLWSMCKGTVTISSEKGKGTAILICIPRNSLEEG